MRSLCQYVELPSFEDGDAIVDAPQQTVGPQSDRGVFNSNILMLFGPIALVSTKYLLVDRGYRKCQVTVAHFKPYNLHCLCASANARQIIVCDHWNKGRIVRC
jgi:hypothetical protein